MLKCSLCHSFDRIYWVVNEVFDKKPVLLHFWSHFTIHFKNVEYRDNARPGVFLWDLHRGDTWTCSHKAQCSCERALSDTQICHQLVCFFLAFFFFFKVFTIKFKSGKAHDHAIDKHHIWDSTHTKTVRKRLFSLHVAIYFRISDIVFVPMDFSLLFLTISIING